jgi:hypothetical protein
MYVISITKLWFFNNQIWKILLLNIERYYCWIYKWKMDNQWFLDSFLGIRVNRDKFNSLRNPPREFLDQREKGNLAPILQIMIPKLSPPRCVISKESVQQKLIDELWFRKQLSTCLFFWTLNYNGHGPRGVAPSDPRASW